MKLITRRNFISIICISFTLIVLAKLIWEKITGFTDNNYTVNIFICLGISVIITIVLATHYYLQRFPFIPVFAGQYLFTVLMVFGLIFIMGHFTDIASTAYRDMFISVTIPFILCAGVYYTIFFQQIKKANIMLEELNG